MLVVVIGRSRVRLRRGGLGVPVPSVLLAPPALPAAPPPNPPMVNGLGDSPPRDEAPRVRGTRGGDAEREAPMRGWEDKDRLPEEGVMVELALGGLT
jgi:hypothetical protein